jgi:aspartate/methionine/tyrosine aminotransferase
MFNETNGAFYNTIIFREGALNHNQKLKIDNTDTRNLVENWVANKTQLDKRFVYYLLGAKGVCVVPISSFCSELHGFRVTLLEENEELLIRVFTDIKEGVVEYLAS